LLCVIYLVFGCQLLVTCYGLQECLSYNFVGFKLQDVLNVLRKVLKLIFAE